MDKDAASTWNTLSTGKAIPSRTGPGSQHQSWTLQAPWSRAITGAIPTIQGPNRARGTSAYTRGYWHDPHSRLPTEPSGTLRNSMDPQRTLWNPMERPRTLRNLTEAYGTVQKVTEPYRSAWNVLPGSIRFHYLPSPSMSFPHRTL